MMLLNILLVGVAGLFWLSFLIMIAGRIVQPHNLVWTRIPILSLVVGAFSSGILILITILTTIFTNLAGYLIGLKVVLLIILPTLFLLPLLLQFMKTDSKTRLANRSIYAIASVFFAALFFLFTGIVAGLVEGTELTIKNVLALVIFIPIFSGVVGAGVFIGLGSSAKIENKLEDQIKKIAKNNQSKY